MDSRAVVEGFWQAMQTNDFAAAAGFLHDQYALEWPQSGELIEGRQNFIHINAHYPSEGQWHFRLNDLIVEDDRVVSDVTVTSGSLRGRAITFHTIRDGKISYQREFWPERFSPAAWRAAWVRLL